MDSKVYEPTFSRSNLITVFSPKYVGIIETLKETFSPLISILNLPSCGNLFSSSFKFARTLILAVIPVAAILGTTGIVLAALYVLIVVQRTLHGETTPGNESLTDLNLREKIAIAPVIAILVVLGFFPKPVLHAINPTTAVIMQNVGVSDPVAKAGK